MGDPEHATHGSHRQVGLVGVDQLEDGFDIFSLFAANQAVAFAKMSRSGDALASHVAFVYSMLVACAAAWLLLIGGLIGLILRRRHSFSEKSRAERDVRRQIS